MLVITEFYNSHEMFFSLALNKFVLINMQFELDKKLGLLYTNGIAFEIRIRCIKFMRRYGQCAQSHYCNIKRKLQ